MQKMGSHTVVECIILCQLELWGSDWTCETGDECKTILYSWSLSF